MATKTCLIICFYGDHHQVVKCRKIQKHPVTRFSQFDFSKMERSPLLQLNSVLFCDPLVKVSSSCLQLWGFIPPIQHRLSNENKEGGDGGKGRGSALLWGRGEPGYWGTCLSVEAVGKRRKGREKEQGLPTISTQGGVSGRLEEHMAVGH